MVSYRKQLIFLIASVLICIALTVSIFIQVNKSAISTIREMNERQMIYVRLAAKGIESVLDHHIALLQTLARNNHIILMDNEGKGIIRGWNNMTDPHIKGATRLNAQGKIIYTFPSISGAIGTNISGQDHVQKALRTQKLAVSDIFETVQGFKSVAIHVPVFRAKTFDGTIAILLSFNDLAKDYLDDLYIPNNRYALLINAQGKIIHCIKPNHLGRSLSEFYHDNTEAVAMINMMMKGKEGEATFIDQNFDDGAKDAHRVYAVYAPVHVGNTAWSVAVISSERLIVPWTQNIINQIIILALMLISFFAITIYVAARIHSASLMTQARQKIEDEQVKSAQEFHDLYHNAPCGYHSLDAKGNIVRMNDMELSWLGFTREELIGKPYTLILAQHSRDRFADAFARLKEQGLVRNVEYDMLRKDGATFPVLVTASAITNPQGTFIMSRSMVLDITLRREQEIQLRESEDLYRTAMEITSDGVCILQHGKFVYSNQKFKNTLGVDNENLFGQSLEDYVHPNDREMLKSYYRKRLRGEPAPANYDLCVVRPDKSPMYLQVNSMRIIYQGKPAILSFIQDITEKKRTENALRESEELYRTAMEKTNDGISIIDIHDGKYQYVNQRLLNTIGRSNEDLIGKIHDTYAHPDDRGLGRKYFLARREGRRDAANYEVRVLKPDGSIVVLKVTAVEIIYQGKPAVLSFLLDITEQKRAEEALRESEALYRTALETTNDGIAIIQDGIYVYTNQKLQNTLGRPDDSLVGEALGTFIHPDDRKMVKIRNLGRFKSAPIPSNYDFRVIKPDNSMVTVNINVVEIVYRGKPAILTFIQDITERRKAEETLRRSEERYRTIIESIDDAYFETDLAGNITFINKPYSWTGHTREEFLRMNYKQISTPEMAKKISREFNKVYREGTSSRIVDYEIISKDGNLAHLEMSVSLIRDSEGKPTGFRCVSRNVSERIKMEEERKKLTEQLYQAQKMEAIGTLAGGIAHDFNNLLMGIQGYTSLMLLEIDTAHPYHEQLKAVQSLVQSGATLTKQLLGFARAGRYEVIPTNLNNLIGKSINLFGRTRKEIRIFEKYAEKIWTVEVDRGQIEQVLLNIFVNAWQAMPGGGSLYLATENVVFDDTAVKIYDFKPGRFVKTSITDTGVGMDEKTRQRIFDPFFTTKEMGRGTGLGLASAYGIINGHGGMITVYSEKGQGTTFNIYLPASLKEVISEEQAESKLSRGCETILLVDDEEVITEVTSRLLEELGYTIITAGSGNEAIEIYAQKHAQIDLVIIDMIMPGMSGSDTFDQLKTINPSVRAILSSGYSINGKAQAIMDRGVRVFLQKPYHLHDLSQKIREALAD